MIEPRIKREPGPERVAEVGAEIARAGIDARQFVGIDPEGLRSPGPEFRIGHQGEIIGIAGSEIGAAALADIGVAAHEMHEPAFVQCHVLPAGTDVDAVTRFGIDIKKAGIGTLDIGPGAGVVPVDVLPDGPRGERRERTIGIERRVAELCCARKAQIRVSLGPAWCAPRALPRDRTAGGEERGIAKPRVDI